jgi:hypothetical protein
LESRQRVFGLEGHMELWQNHLSMLQKFKQPMPTKTHEFFYEDNDNDDPLQKICKFQLSSMS